jgi:hypothetical protein
MATMSIMIKVQAAGHKYDTNFIFNLSPHLLSMRLKVKLSINTN